MMICDYRKQTHSSPVPCHYTHTRYPQCTSRSPHKVNQGCSKQNSPCAHIVHELELIELDGLPPLFEPPIGVAIYNNLIEVVTTPTSSLNDLDHCTSYLHRVGCMDAIISLSSLEPHQQIDGKNSHAYSQ